MSSADILTIIHQTAYGLLLLIIWALTRPVYADFRRHRSGYGVVFDSHTGRPEANAVIRFKNPQGLVVRTVVADRDGRYRLAAPKGEYFVEVSKAGYTFPSVYMTKKKSNPFYDNVLASHHIMIQDYGTITKNIPIDPTGEAKKPSWLLTKVNLGKNSQYLLAFLGTGAVLYLAALQGRSPWPWVMFLVYLIIMLGRLLTFKPPQPPFGTVYDAATGQPLAQTIVRLSDKRFNKLIETQITSPKGRYAFIVNRGDFRLMIEKPGYRKVMVNFPNVKQDGFLMAKDVGMKISSSA